MQIIIYTNSEDPHADLMEKVFIRRKIITHKINTDEVFNNGGFTTDILKKNILHLSRKDIPLNKIASIWYRRPKNPLIHSASYQPHIHHFCSQECEAGLLGMLLNIKAKWVNHPSCINLANYKIYQLKIAEECGFKIPKTIVSNNREIVQFFFKTCANGVIYKPLKSGAIEVDDHTSAAIYTSEIKMTKKLSDGVPLAPGIYQELLEKRYDVRVTIFGNKIFAAAIDSSKMKEIDVRCRLLELEHKSIELPSKIKQRCIKLLKRFNLLFGAIDLIKTRDGNYIFLELNPNGQWGWLEKKLNLPLSEALADLLITPRS